MWIANHLTVILGVISRHKYTYSYYFSLIDIQYAICCRYYQDMILLLSYTRHYDLIATLCHSSAILKHNKHSTKNHIKSRLPKPPNGLKRSSSTSKLGAKSFTAARKNLVSRRHVCSVTGSTLYIHKRHTTLSSHT